MEISIRDWSRDDLPEIQRAWLAFAISAARSDMRLKPDAEAAMMQFLVTRFKEKGAFGFIAERGQERAGFLIGRIDDWESVPPIIQPRKLGMIDAVYVNETFRRQGIASVLINRAVELMRARNVAAVETIFDAWSDASSETWQRSGFAPWMVHAYRML